MEKLNFYRIKTSWVAEKADGNLTKVKTEELVHAVNYTDAEKVAYAIVQDQNRTKFGDIEIEILKTKIEDLAYDNVLLQDENLVEGLVYNYFAEPDDSGVGLYAVKVMFIEIDERSGKEKRTNSTIYIPAVSNANAVDSLHLYLKKCGEMREYVVRDVKYDKAEAILWSVDVHKAKTNQTE